MQKKQKSLKVLKIFSLLAVLTMLSGACGSSKPAARVTLVYWKLFDSQDNLQPVFQAFQKNHPNITIQYVEKDVNTYEQDLINALAAGTGPDIYSINNAWLPKYKDKIAPATSTLWSFKDYKDAFADVAVKDFTLNNQVYGVPLALDSLALYYNKDILGTNGIATPPKTWDELCQMCKKLSAPTAMDILPPAGLPWAQTAMSTGPRIFYIY